MLDGRVKTLHPRVHGGLLYVRGNAEHEAAVAAHGIQPIDMVVVNLYAFEKTAAQPGVAFGHLIENIDIGGPSMVRSAAKNFEDVAIVTRVADYPALIEELKSTDGALSRETRWRLAKQAFATTAAYDTAIANTLDQIAEAPAPDQPAERLTQPSFPTTLRINLPLAQSLRYGENPHQRAALYSDGTGLGIAGATQLQGKELSFNNLVDLDACWELAQELRTNRPAASPSSSTPTPAARPPAPPCSRPTRRRWNAIRFRPSAASSASTGPWTARRRRRSPSSSSRPSSRPAFTPEARERFAAKKNLRLVEVHSAPPRPVVKHVSGGLLLQDADTGRVAESELDVVTWRPPTAEELRSLLFAWRVCKHVKSNAIVYARDGQTVGIGAGQMSRVDAARFGAMKAVLPLQGMRGRLRRLLPLPRRP